MKIEARKWVNPLPDVIKPTRTDVPMYVVPVLLNVCVYAPTATAAENYVYSVLDDPLDNLDTHLLIQFEPEDYEVEYVAIEIDDVDEPPEGYIRKEDACDHCEHDWSLDK